MTWPDPEPGMPADDYTREHRALYDRIRHEAAQRPVLDPEPRWFTQGPTAAWAEHRDQFLLSAAWIALTPADDSDDDELEPGAA